MWSPRSRLNRFGGEHLYLLRYSGVCVRERDFHVLLNMIAGVCGEVLHLFIKDIDLQLAFFFLEMFGFGNGHARPLE